MLSNRDLRRELNAFFLNKRLKTGKFSYQELQAIAEAMGAKLELSFVIGN